MSEATYHGSCLCASIKYEVEAIGPKMAHCHCSMCRKFHGAAFATFGEARREHFRWLQGETLLGSYTAPNGSLRQFCRNCGSSLVFVPKGHPELVEFALGTLDSGLDLRPDAHIYVGSKAEWEEIHDQLPQFAEGRDSAEISTETEAD